MIGRTAKALTEAAGLVRGPHRVVPLIQKLALDRIRVTFEPRHLYSYTTTMRATGDALGLLIRWLLEAQRAEGGIAAYYSLLAAASGDRRLVFNLRKRGIAWQAIFIFRAVRLHPGQVRLPIGRLERAVAPRLVLHPLSHCLVLNLFHRRRVVAHDLNKVVDQIKDVMSRSEEAQPLVERELVDPR